MARFSACWATGIPPTWVVICGAILVQVGFGVYPVVVKKFAAKNKADPVVFSFYRDLCCFPVLFLCSFVAERKLLIPRLDMLVLFVILGFLGMFGNQLLYILGVYWAGPDVASALQPVIPVWTAIFAVLTCTERFTSLRLLHTWTKIFAIFISAAGAIEVTLTGVEGQNSATNSHLLRVLGYVSLFANTICMAMYVLVQKRFIFNRPNCEWKDYPVAVTAYSYFFGAVFMGLAAVVWTLASGDTSKFRIPAESAYALVYAIFIASALCYLLITWANLHLPSTVVTAFWPFQVLVAVILSYVALGIKLAPWQYLGVLLIIAGLLVLVFSNHMEERASGGKAVVRVDCLCPQRLKDETTPLYTGTVEQPGIAGKIWSSVNN